MGIYRKKPVEIEAFKIGIDPRPDWFCDKMTLGEIETFYVDDIEFSNPFEETKTYCKIHTLEGVMKGNYGDYIILGVAGEVYPCKEEIFLKTYEKV